MLFKRSGQKTASIRSLYWLLAISLAAFAAPAWSHSFGTLYTLPVPFWLYAWGSAAALLLSFLLVAWFASDQRAAQDSPQPVRQKNLFVVSPIAILALRIVSLFALLLCIATGLWGTANAFLNFNMTFFWIIFVLGFAYFSALVGDLYPLVNPWQTMVLCLAAVFKIDFSGRIRWGEKLEYWPALLLYIGFIWFELFGGSGPRGLASVLLAYSVFNLVAAWLIGSERWFKQGEFFAVLFALISKMAPISIQARDESQSRPAVILRMPFSGLQIGKASSMSELLFVLFLLSSTAFDGLHSTNIWATFFWQDIAGIYREYKGQNIVQAYPVLKAAHGVFETTVLVLSPLFYLGVLYFFLAIVRRLTKYHASLSSLALHFTYSLLPIALVYHITHYYTLISTQGVMIWRLISDPFGWSWNLFGSAHWRPESVIPNMDWVWHTQVGLILFGHALSVYLAHKEALQLFPQRRQATLSQLPMLVLMIIFTCFGLWILAQPVTATRL
ncbi:hypothetical protein [Zhongshania sp.]|uniref:hypothetical protein n=1 Tax=Zhongshania sp. TaxID=1971902 RepID=UPI001B7B8E7E|nr:hypothetical protein [Zhongshania sp.]MBQ0797352.1 hypothetical protein [Zhongshania sp.]